MRLLFPVTLLVSAALLFLVEPMIAKMILPLLGGSPSVWNTCVVFFQAALLAGYLYAHAMPAWLGVRRHALIHLGVLLIPLLVLPIGVRHWTPPASADPAPWLLTMLAAVVGLPFFALATSAPLLQRWFGEIGGPEGRDPYFLYAASNLGSMVALLGYPLVIEPHLRLATQSVLWTVGYALAVALTTACAVTLWRAPRTDREEIAPEVAIPPPSIGRRLRWIALAFVPSSLMLGVTTYLSTDISAFPLLWVIPLAIYLLSFIMVFSRPPALLHRAMVVLLPLAILALIAAKVLQPVMSIGVTIALHLAALFVASMVCHGELARDRPPVRHLTEFYLWISVGGVLGGAATALLAPRIFDRVIEYPLMIAFACLLMIRPAPRTTAAAGGAAGTPRPTDPDRGGVADPRRSARPRGAERSKRHAPAPAPRRAVAPTAATARPAGSMNLAWGGFGLFALAALFVQSFAGDPRLLLHSERDFFGVHRVRMERRQELIALVHGSTVHGVQNVTASRRSEPLSYYSRSGPIGQLFAAFSGTAAKRHVAMVGLGVGSLAAYFGPGQQLTFYEIDPTVDRLAHDASYFTFLRDAERRGVTLGVVLGDARLSLARAHRRYDLIVLDAFSSDAIPVHLLTREALHLYLDCLEPGGLLAFHISSKYFRLQPVLEGLARDAGMVCRFEEDAAGPTEARSGKTASQWAVMARREQDLGPLAVDPLWHEGRAGATAPLWTDDYSNLMGVIRWEGGRTTALARYPGKF